MTKRIDFLVISIFVFSCLVIATFAEAKSMGKIKSDKKETKSKKIKLGKDIVDISKADWKREVKIGEFFDTQLFKDKKIKWWRNKKAVLSPKGKFIAKIENSYGEYEEDGEAKIELYSIDGKKIFEKRTKPENGYSRGIGRCAILKDGKYIIFHTGDFYGNYKLEIYSQKGDVILIKKNIGEDDFWVAPLGNYVLIREILEKDDEGNTLKTKLQKIDLDGKEKELYEFYSNFSIHPSNGFSGNGKYFIVFIGSDRGADFYKILLFTQNNFLWMKEVKASGGFMAKLSKSNRYVIVEITKVLERQGNKVIRMGKEYNIYINPEGELFYKGTLSQENLRKYYLK